MVSWFGLGFGWVAWYCCWVLSIIRSFARLIKWKLFGNESWKSRWDVEWVWYLGKKGAFSVIFRIILYKCCCFPFFRWSKFPRDYIKRLFFFIFPSIQHFIHSPVSFYSFYILIIPLENFNLTSHNVVLASCSTSRHHHHTK